jgi:starch-binding outer membrane protein, SusD/RagB family
MKNFKFNIITLGLSLLLFSSCVNDLDTKPKVELSFENLLQQDPNAALGLLSKMYGTFALSSSDGPSSSDITAPDFTADDIKNRWGDNGLDQLTTTAKWDENNKFFRYLYDRINYTLPNCNNIIKALGTTNVENKDQYVAELRFLRSLAYYYMIDCFGKGVLVTEADLGSTEAKPEASRKELFDFVESELKAIEPTMPAKNSYGRANQSAVRMLLAKLYLNAEVYTGTPRYNDAAIYAKKVIDEGGYTLSPNFASVFSRDNNTSTEIIFPLVADALVSQSYGNTTYLVNGSIDASTMSASTYGMTGNGWGGHRATKAWYSLYGNLVGNQDDRAKLFWTAGHNFEMNDYKTWTDGYPSIKFTNTNFSGASNLTDFVGTDFPLFRLADAYLMYAECNLRGAASTTPALALQYVNAVRTRSHAAAITSTDLNLNYILDERARELNLEGHRRTDLIRFGKFTGGTYLWPWKGGVKDGTSIPATYNIFPIPLTALNANPNLKQNPGY